MLYSGLRRLSYMCDEVAARSGMRAVQLSERAASIRSPSECRFTAHAMHLTGRAIFPTRPRRAPAPKPVA